MSKVDLDTIEQFRRLAPDVRRSLAERFGLIESGDEPRPDSFHTWLLRANERGLGIEFGRAVQEAPQ